MLLLYIVDSQLFAQLLHDGAHLVVLALHTLQEFVLRASADKVVVGVGGLVVLVAVNVVHQEAQHLLEGDITTCKGKPIQLTLCH